MTSFFRALMATPDGPPSLLSRYTVACGVAYLVIGLAFYAGAGPIGGTIEAVEGVVMDTGLVRALGMTVAIIGWFYIFGGRTRADSFALSTVVDRLLVPAFLLPLWALGELPASLALPFSILDPALGLVAYAIWRREQGVVAPV